MSTYPGPERRRHDRNRELTKARIFALIGGGLLLLLAWFAYEVVRSIYVR